MKDLTHLTAARWLAPNEVVFEVDGYVINFTHRASTALVVAFGPMKVGPAPQSGWPIWGASFLHRKRLSALTITPTDNCWYRGQALRQFFEAAASVGLFSHFNRVMTYGGSMGGFGALSFARLAGANVCLALNPQVCLGPKVRAWESRFLVADKQDWVGPLSDVNAEIEDVAHLVLAYDPYCDLDRRQVELIERRDCIHLRVPFVGHHLPVHLQRMGLLGQIFDDALAGVTSAAGYSPLFRRRRMLRRYRNILTERCRGRPLLQRIVEENLAGELVGME